jgi:cardiolipin synthase
MPDRRFSRRRLIALASGASLASCAAVPDTDEYLRPEDGGGALQDAAGDGILQRQFALQQVLSESPLTAGNQVRLLRDGQQALSAMFDAMRQARDHINLEYFIFEDVQVGQSHLSDMLIGRLAAGVAVNVIYDAYGSQATPASMFDELRSAGARVVVFNPIDPLAALSGHSPNERDHRKIMVVDGQIGIVGGINLARVYENPPAAGSPPDGDEAHAYWRDTAAEMRGPVVAELQRLFFDTWSKQKGDPVRPAKYFPPLPREGVQVVRIIGSTPGEKRPLYYLSLETAIRGAVHQAWLSSGYFVPPHQEREDLAKTARRGVDLRLVVPSHTDVHDAVYAGRAAYGDLLEAGARIYEMRNAVLHSKIAVVDGVWTSIGSSNLDRRGVVFNNEVDAIVLGTETASQFQALLERDMANSVRITLQAWQRRPFDERVHELGARLWQYWMIAVTRDSAAWGPVCALGHSHIATNAGSTPLAAPRGGEGWGQVGQCRCDS